MPIYEFKCGECGKRFEKLVLRAGDAAEVVCASCGSRDVHQQFSSFASMSGVSSTSGGSSCAPGGG